MTDLAAALSRARSLDVEKLATSIERIGFSCTRCGECCRGEVADPHTATVQPDEVRALREASSGEWRDVARPVPFGLDTDGHGETFEWSLATNGCGDCTFLETDPDGTTSCGVYQHRPAICRTYPFQVDVVGSTAPQADPVDREGDVIAHACEGLGGEIDHEDAIALAAEVKERTIRDVEAARSVLAEYEPTSATDRAVVFDAEGPKRVDGSRIDD